MTLIILLIGSLGIELIIRLLVHKELEKTRCARRNKSNRG